jgi:hypothetical protein
MKNCEQRCNNKQIKVNEKQSEINKVDNKPGRYSTDELKQFNQLKTELHNLNLDLQRCIDECKLRNRHRDDDSTDGTPVDMAVDPGILQELEALEKEEEEEEYSGGRTRSTIRRRNKNKTKRRQTRSTRRRKTRRRRRKTRKQ